MLIIALFTEGEIQTAVEKKALLDAINRAKLCGAQEDKAPVLLNVSGQNINITYKEPDSRLYGGCQHANRCRGRTENSIQSNTGYGVCKGF